MTATRDRTLSTATFPNVREQQITDEDIRKRAAMDGDIDLNAATPVEDQDGFDEFYPIEPEEYVSEAEYLPVDGFDYDDDELRLAVESYNEAFPDRPQLTYEMVTLARNTILAECTLNRRNVDGLCAAQTTRMVGNLARRLKIAAS